MARDYWEWHDKKILLFETHKNCAYCGIELTLKTATIDHIIPKSKGGSDENENLTLACSGCNHRKANSTAKTWLHWLEDNEYKTSNSDAKRFEDATG